jgi:glycerol-3-phosphate O-acyltransferase
LEAVLRNDHHYTAERLLDSYLQQKFIEKISEEKDDYAVDTLYRMNDNKRPVLEYYKNNCIALFITTAFTALSILEKDTFQFSIDDISPRYDFLRNLFKNEFVYHVDRSPEEDIRRVIDAFISDGMIQQHPGLPDTFNLTSTGLRKLKVHSSFLRTYFESYWIVLKYFMRYPQNSVDAKERLKRIQTMGNRMFKRNEIELKEALSKVNYDNAIAYFTTHGIKGAEDTDKIEFYADEIQKSLNHLST